MQRVSHFIVFSGYGVKDVKHLRGALLLRELCPAWKQQGCLFFWKHALFSSCLWLRRYCCFPLFLFGIGRLFFEAFVYYVAVTQQDINSPGSFFLYIFQYICTKMTNLASGVSALLMLRSSLPTGTRLPSHIAVSQWLYVFSECLDKNVASSIYLCTLFTMGGRNSPKV